MDLGYNNRKSTGSSRSANSHSASTKTTDGKPFSLNQTQNMNAQECVEAIKTAFDPPKKSTTKEKQDGTDSNNVSEDDDEPIIQGEGMNKKLVKKKETKAKLILCTANVRYVVIKKVCRRMDFKLNESEEADWDLYWTDVGIQPEKMVKL